MKTEVQETKTIIYRNNELNDQNREGPEKWLACFAYSLLSFSNVLGFVSYSPVWLGAAAYYSIEPNTLLWLSNIFYLTYPAFAPFLMGPILTRFDLSMYAAGFASTLGTWMIWMGGQDYLWAVIGYIIVGIGQAIILGVPIRIIFQFNFEEFADLYFNTYQRTLITCITSQANLAGISFMFSFSSLYFSDVVDQTLINQRIEEVNLLIAIFNSFALFFALMFIRQKIREVNLDEERLIVQIKKTFMSEDHMFDTIAFGFIIALGWSYSTILQIELYNYNFNSKDISLIAIIYNFCGLTTGLFIGISLDKRVSQGKQPDYDKYIRVAAALALICQVFQAFLIKYMDFYSILVINLLIGIGLFSIYPLSMCAVSEKFYPMSSLWLVTLTLSVGCIIGTVDNYLLIVPQFLPYCFWIGLIQISPFALYFLIFYKTKYRKFELMQI